VNIAMNVGSLVVAPLVVWGAMRWALPPTEDRGASPGFHPVRWLAWIFAALAVILGLYLVSNLAITLGRALALVLGDFAFLGDFVASLGEILRLILTPICALIGAGLLSSMAGQWGQRVVERVRGPTLFILHLVLATAAGATLAAMIGGAIAWLYEIRNPAATLYWPAAAGAAGGLLLALRTRYNAPLPVGLAIYSVTRTILNALRSVEALIMVIVFAVWVGIGPFAGVLALGLHTVAALAKLYSEQVENIMAGPIEAILATGANRLQMIIYAVIPQIIPPYISFTMYRWDINVRMSTIIGFAGGGGIGFLLQQNINLLNYRAASAQILAIAVVVSLMDYLSSALRQRAV
jgi:phosphonate ABC transporter permease subunit PhnE